VQCSNITINYSGGYLEADVGDLPNYLSKVDPFSIINGWIEVIRDEGTGKKYIYVFTTHSRFVQPHEKVFDESLNRLAKELLWVLYSSYGSVRSSGTYPIVIVKGKQTPLINKFVMVIGTKREANNDGVAIRGKACLLSIEEFRDFINLLGKPIPVIWVNASGNRTIKFNILQPSPDIELSDNRVEMYRTFGSDMYVVGSAGVRFFLDERNRDYVVATAMYYLANKNPIKLHLLLPLLMKRKLRLRCENGEKVLVQYFVDYNYRDYTQALANLCHFEDLAEIKKLAKVDVFDRVRGRLIRSVLV